METAHQSPFGARHAGHDLGGGSPMGSTSELRLVQDTGAPPVEDAATPFSELESFVRREVELRQELQQQIKVYERELAKLRSADGASSGEAEERAARLEAAEQELGAARAELAAA